MTDDPQWLSDPEIRAWLALTAMIESLPAVLGAELKDAAGINHFEYMVLAGLSEAPNRCAPMSEIAAFACGSISRVSHALTRMEKRGWIRRSPRGQRGQITVELSGEGMDVVRLAAPGHVAAVRRVVVDRLGSDRVLEFGRMAESILAEINPDGLAVIDDRYPAAGR